MANNLFVCHLSTQEPKEILATRFFSSAVQVVGGEHRWGGGVIIPDCNGVWQAIRQNVVEHLTAFVVLWQRPSGTEHGTAPKIYEDGPK
jgi:hypothetical protein